MSRAIVVGVMVAAAATLSACAHRTTSVTTAPEGAGTSTAPTAGPQDFASSVRDRVFFETDRSDLSAEARQILSQQAAWLQRHPGANVLIAGNCDERGTREYNLALGARRAAAARDYLISLGIASARIQTISYGKERPTDPRHTEAAWAANRNAHTQVVNMPTS